jgi:ankyrin repeat protein
VDFLLNNNANIEARNQEGKTSLHLAVLMGYKNLVGNLLKRGANTEVLI